MKAILFDYFDQEAKDSVESKHKASISETQYRTFDRTRVQSFKNWARTSYNNDETLYLNNSVELSNSKIKDIKEGINRHNINLLDESLINDNLKVNDSTTLHVHSIKSSKPTEGQKMKIMYNFNLKKIEENEKEYSRQKMNSIWKLTKIDFDNKSFCGKSQMLNNSKWNIKTNRMRIMSAVPKSMYFIILEAYII